MVIIKGKDKGKTHDLIKLADGGSGYIVCSSRDEAHRISHQAIEMGKNILFPITYDEFFHYCGYPTKFYFDNFDMFIENTIEGMFRGRKIDTVTMSEDFSISRLLERFIHG